MITELDVNVVFVRLPLIFLALVIFRAFVVIENLTHIGVISCKLLLLFFFFPLSRTFGFRFFLNEVKILIWYFSLFGAFSTLVSLIYFRYGRLHIKGICTWLLYRGSMFQAESTIVKSSATCQLFHYVDRLSHRGHCSRAANFLILDLSILSISHHVSIRIFVSITVISQVVH